MISHNPIHHNSLQTPTNLALILHHSPMSPTNYLGRAINQHPKASAKFEETYSEGKIFIRGRNAGNQM